MAKIAPFTFWQSLDDNGNPLAGGKLYTYAAGTSTPKQTFTDSTEASANTNPIILDANGRAGVWLDVGAYKFILDDADDVLVATTDNIVGDAVNVFGSSVEAVSVNTSVGSAFENVIIDCTAALTLSLLDVTAAQEGFIFAVRNSSTGDVIIDPDGLELIDGASTLTVVAGQSVMVACTGTSWLSLYASEITASADNTFTGVNTFQAATTFEADVALTGSQLQLNKGADVASAAALPIITDGNYFDVTGVAAITSIATTGKIGTVIKLHFDGILTLTHDATSLILPSAANITTAAGDEAEFIEYASGDWRCTNYSKASGESLVTTIATYTSGATTLTSGTLATFAHSLGARPFMVQIELINVTGEAGYSTGDIIPFFTDSDTSNSTTTGIGVRTDATNVYLIPSNGSTITYYPTKTTGVRAAITYANWQVIVKAVNF